MAAVRAPRFEGPARTRAIRALDQTVELFARAGYDGVRRTDLLAATVSARNGRSLRLDMAREGKVFGGNYALEISTAKPVLPVTRGISARGRGVVKLAGITFHARRGDDAGKRLAARLAAESELVEKLAAVHFERVRVDPDGRAVIRHLGGSLVWIAFPPLIKAIPLVPDQVKATDAALTAFARAGSRV